MRIQDRDKKGFIWVFHGQDDHGGELVLYVFATDRSSDTPKDVLGDNSGALVCDGFTGYNVVEDPGQRVRGGCWCHARRKFFEAKSTAPQGAERAISEMRELFRVEHEARLRRIVGTAEHLALRTARSKPVVDKLFDWLVEHKACYHRATRGPESPRSPRARGPLTEGVCGGPGFQKTHEEVLIFSLGEPSDRRGLIPRSPCSAPVTRTAQSNLRSADRAEGAALHVDCLACQENAIASA